MSRDDWRDRFDRFAKSLSGRGVYVTVDLDCLREEEAVTNWENGLFTAEDVAWAVTRLRESTSVVGGDVCGAHSPPAYARRTQRFAGEWDRPKRAAPDRVHARRVNLSSLQTIWPAMSDFPPAGAISDRRDS